MTVADPRSHGPRADRRPLHHDFGLELERARREAGLKPKELAEQLFVAPRTVRRYLNGERLPTIEVTEAWERACNTEPGRLSRIHPDRTRANPYPAGEYAASSAAEDADSGQATGKGAVPQARRWWALAAVAALIVGGAILMVTLLSGDGESQGKIEQTVARAKRLSTTHQERTGSSARTWSDFTIAGGDPGPPINGRRTVRVTCRIRGFEVRSGNQWWYLVASAPWRNNYFATADAFYNQRRTAGVDFRKTRFVDLNVPLCP